MQALNTSLSDSATVVAGLKERVIELQRTLASSEQDRRVLQERFDNTRSDQTCPSLCTLKTRSHRVLCTIMTRYRLLGPVAPISVNFNHQLIQHHRHDNSNSRVTSANSSSVKSVSQLTVQLTELGATGP